MKSTAPFFIASTAFSMVPKADIAMTGVWSVLGAKLFDEGEAVHARQFEIGQDEVDIM